LNKTEVESRPFSPNTETNNYVNNKANFDQIESNAFKVGFKLNNVSEKSKL